MRVLACVNPTMLPAVSVPSVESSGCRSRNHLAPNVKVAPLPMAGYRTVSRAAVIACRLVDRILERRRGQISRATMSVSELSTLMRARSRFAA